MTTQAQQWRNGERAESIERARACNSPREQWRIPAVLLKTFQIESQLPKDPHNRL